MQASRDGGVAVPIRVEDGSLYALGRRRSERPGAVATRPLRRAPREDAASLANVAEASAFCAVVVLLAAAVLHPVTAFHTFLRRGWSVAATPVQGGHRLSDVLAGLVVGMTSIRSAVALHASIAAAVPLGDSSAFLGNVMTNIRARGVLASGAAVAASGPAR